MLERINLILKSRNLNAAQFADEIGVQRSSVSHILTGRNNASLDFLLKVLTRYPELDTDWLLTGKGVMVRTASLSSKNTNEVKKIETSNAVSNPSDIELPIDLFRQPDDIREEIRGKNIVNEEINEDIRGEYQRFIKTGEQQKMPDEMANKTISARQIDRIVIFYSDRTFTDYKPEN